MDSYLRMMEPLRTEIRLLSLEMRHINANLMEVVRLASCEEEPETPRTLMGDISIRGGVLLRIKVFPGLGS